MKNATLIIALLSLLTLPGVTPAANPVTYLPGMSGGLPQPVISDLTNYPNPFDSRKAGVEGRTTISYQLVQDARVEFEIYDLFGRKVRGWEIEAGSNGGRAGDNQVVWDGTDASGRKVAKGGYLASIVIETPQTTVTAVRKIGVIH